MGWAAEGRLALEALQSPSRPVVLVAPWRGGKSWMLRRLLHGLPPDDAVARLCPRAMPPETLTDLERCFELLALLVCAAVGLPEESAEVALSGAEPVPWRLKRWMGRTALPAARGREAVVRVGVGAAERWGTGAGGRATPRPARNHIDITHSISNYLACRDQGPWERKRLLARRAFDAL